MRGPRKWMGGTDLASGVAAAAAFLAMVFPLHMVLWVSALLAAGVYLGVSLATRGSGRESAESVTEGELIHRIEQQSRPISNPRVRSRIAQICQQASGVLFFLEEHPEKAEAWRGIVRECLQSTLRVVERYVEFSRFLDNPSQQSMREVEELLDQVSGTFAGLRRRLVDEGAADLSAEMAVFRSTLQALEEVNVLNRGGGAS
jgi:hypothetical protein